MSLSEPSRPTRPERVYDRAPGTDRETLRTQAGPPMSPDLPDPRRSTIQEAASAYARLTRQPAALTPQGILALQRMIGNAALTHLLRQPAMPPPALPLQRTIQFRQMTGEITTPSLDQIKVWLGREGYVIPTGSPQEQAIRAMQAQDTIRIFDWAYGQRRLMMMIREGTEPGRDESHLNWLQGERERVEQVQGQVSSLLPLLFHGETTTPKQGGSPFDHYNLFDLNMLWRFTSLPTQEAVFIEMGTPYEEILQVIASHSGGNDKSNPRVKTLSFGRNLSALLGTAASKGGDKQVLYIIDQAEYLYGINIASLANKRITAHPARARAISLFETEYVLVASPGQPPHTLEELATVRYQNPFKGLAAGGMLREDPSIRQGLLGAKEKLGTLAPERISSAMAMHPQDVAALWRLAKAVRKAANHFGVLIMDKEAVEPGQMPALERQLIQYGKLIETYRQEIERLEQQKRLQKTKQLEKVKK